MPNMNSHEILRRLRNDPWGKDVKVLFLTNNDDPKNITKGFEHKSNYYIIKSNINLDEVSKQIKQRLTSYYHHSH